MIQEEIKNPYITWMDNMAVKLPKQNPYDVKVPMAPPSTAPADGPIINDYGAMNADMKQPATSPAPTATGQPQKTPYDPQKYIDAIFNAEVPKPEYDQQRQTRTRDLSKVLALGDALSTLGDVFALGRGANVTPRGPNNDVRHLRSQWQQYEDAYRMRMDQYNRDVFQNKLNALRYGSQMQYQMDRDRYRDEKEDQRFNWQKEIQDKQFQSIDEDRKERRKDREEDNALRKEQFEYNKKMEERRFGLEASRFSMAKQAAQREMLNNSGLSTDDKDNIILAGDQIGQEIRIDKRYRDHLLSLITQDKLLTTDDMDLLSPSAGENVTTNQKDFLIAKYWNRSPAVQKWLHGEQSSGGYTEEQMNAVRDMALGRSVAPVGSQSFKAPTTTPTKQGKTNWDSYELK